MDELIKRLKKRYEEELADEALVKRKAEYRVCNFCLRDIIPSRYKIPKGRLMPYKSGKVM